MGDSLPPGRRFRYGRYSERVILSKEWPCGGWTLYVAERAGRDRVVAADLAS